MYNFFLPKDYQINSNPVYFKDSFVDDKIHQPHIYELAKFLANRTKDVEYIIDIGCGNGEKLKGLNSKIRLIGVDIGENLELFKKNFPNSVAIECNLEKDFPGFSDNVLKKSIVICADVVEHLYNPTRLLKGLAKISYLSPFLLISTPDRILNRGNEHLGPPPNKAHVREWTKKEFEKMLRHFKFNSFISGYTVNNNIDLAKKTILVISGYLAFPKKPEKKKLKILAFVPMYNEEDIIESTLTYLCEQEIDVVVIDNWSSDKSIQLVKHLQKKYKNISLEKFPKKRSKYYLWREILGYIEKIASTKKEYDWFIKNDADEIFLSPWENVSLYSGIQMVDRLGYDAIDATVVNYQYLEKRIQEKFDSQKLSGKFFSFGLMPGYFQQVNIWKKKPNLTLAETGGHRAIENGWIFPLKFLKLHYPLRSVEHAKKKIYVDRLPRYVKEKKLYKWHIQYDNINSSFPNLTCTYYSFSINREFFEKYLVERVSGIGIKNERRNMNSETLLNNTGECRECLKHKEENLMLKYQLRKITLSKTYKAWQFYCRVRDKFFGLFTSLLKFLRKKS